jgi:hypothetical protein
VDDSLDQIGKLNDGMKSGRDERRPYETPSEVVDEARTVGT